MQRQAPPARFAVGTAVEYKSKTANAWIEAIVEGFNEATKTYKLDVQPLAQADKVRLRQQVAEAAAAEPAAPAAPAAPPAAPPAKVSEPQPPHPAEEAAAQDLNFRICYKFTLNP